MSKQKQVHLDTSSILTVPFQIYEPKFSFIVNGKEFKTSRLIADILSPVICRHHSNDPTLDTFTINTRNDGNFSHILNLINFQTTTFSEEEIPFLTEVVENLGNETIILQDEKDSTEITIDNVLHLLQHHEKYSQFYCNHISSEIEFVSSHFTEISEMQEEELKKLSIGTLLKIISNDQLQMKSEDQLLKLINELYSNNSEYSILYEQVLFTNVTSEMMKEFVLTFDANDMTIGTWHKLSDRLCLEPENQVSNTAAGSRYSKAPKQETGKTFEYTEDKVFKGIFNYLQTQTGGKIENEVNFTSSSVASSSDCYKPSNVALFGDTNNYFHSKNVEGSWICFDFNDRRVVPTHYTVKSVNWGVNDHHPKSWVIEGSNDNISWETIDEEKNCSYLNGVSLVHTFPMNHPKSTEFKYIRMRSTGPNWCGNSYHYLIFDSFEIYGRLI